MKSKKKPTVTLYLTPAPPRGAKYQPTTEESLRAITNATKRKAIIERCGPDVIATGIECTHCGASEVYANAKDPKDQDKWYWMIRAFRVDNASDCRNCNQWFTL